jgi:hypothetical protein
MDNTHFVFLDRLQDAQMVMATVAAKWWNIVEISDEIAIKQHQLFGDKVWYINLPQFENIKVLMIVFFEQRDDAWFVQVDHDIYYQRKSALLATFDTRYDW